MTQVLFCQRPECLGWEVRGDERYCGWCGSRLVDLAMSLRIQRDLAWGPLDPPVLVHGSRPKLQLVLRHSGQTGTVEIRPESIACSAEWLELERPEGPIILHPGGERGLEVRTFKKLESEEKVFEARFAAEAGDLKAEVRLEVVPLPEFGLEPPSVDVTLVGEEDLRIPLSLVLQKGRTTLLEPPAIDADWAVLEWGPDVIFPCPMDAATRRVLHGVLRVPRERLAALQGVPRKSLSLALRCTGREEAPPRQVLDLRFQGTPQLVVEPFRAHARYDWCPVRGATDREDLELVLHNGAELGGGRAPLELRRLDVVDPAGAAPWVEVVDPPFPLTLQAGETARVRLRLGSDTPVGELRVFSLAFDTNELRPRNLFLGVRLQEPRPFEGWLVVDFGTTNTCAALVDEQCTPVMVDLEESPRSPDGADTLRSAIVYHRLHERRDYRLGWMVWSHFVDFERSALMGVKRRAGDRRHQYEVVPVAEPHTTARVAVREVLEDFYRHVVARAARFLARGGRTDLLLHRVLVTHPSRFATRQIEDLRQAARRALTEHLQARGAEHLAVEDRTLQEPVAAALSFLNRWEAHAPLHDRRGGAERVSYHVLVYDAGGGTVDLTLVEVESRRKLPPGHEAEPGLRSEADLEAALGRILDRGAGRPELAAVLQELTLKRCGEVLGPEEGRLPRAEDAGKALKVNDFVLRNFAQSILAADPIDALVAGDGRRWERLRESPQVNRQLELKVLREGELEDRTFWAEEVFPRLPEARRALVQRVESGPEAGRLRPEAYQYRVHARVLSAAGHARFGGEEMTEAVRQLLVERLVQAAGRRYPGEAVVLPLDPKTVPIQQDLAARKNSALLLLWAESVKIALAEGRNCEDLRDPEGEDPNLRFFLQGREKAIGLRDLLGSSSWPTREEVDERLRPDLAGTVRLARDMLQSAGVERPEYVLPVGKASQWPLVRDLLGLEFPDSEVRPLEEAKECVVQGAALFAPTGPQVHMGPGIRLQVLGSGQITTSRLGIQAQAWGGAAFAQIVPVGVEIPEDGRLDRLPGLGLHLGENVIKVLENVGLDDRMHRDGAPNPDIAEVRTLRFEIPEEVDLFALDEATVEFHLSSTLRLTVRVLVPGLEPFLFPPDEGGEIGTIY